MWLISYVCQWEWTGNVEWSSFANQIVRGLASRSLNDSVGNMCQVQRQIICAKMSDIIGVPMRGEIEEMGGPEQKSDNGWTGGDPGKPSRTKEEPGRKYHCDMFRGCEVTSLLKVNIKL